MHKLNIIYYIIYKSIYILCMILNYKNLPFKQFINNITINF